MVRLFRGREEAALREVLARQAGADLGQAWHKIIQVRHLFPLLQEIGWANAELPLRSAARVVAVGAEFGGEFPANRVLAAGMGAAALSGSRDDAAVSQLLETMRVGDSATIALAARDMLLACVAPESIWDAARLFAIECMMNNSFAMG